MLFLRDSINASITNLNSGIKEITLSSLASRSNLKTKTEEPVVGINDEITIIKSNMFHPLLKKFTLLFSAKKRINISIIKKTVMKVSRTNKILTNRSLPIS